MFEKSKFYEAVKKNDVVTAEAVLQKKPELLYAMMINHEASPLAMALQHGHAEMMAFLAEKDPELKSRGGNGGNILFDALVYGRYKFLKEHGAERPDLLKARDYRNASLLHKAAESTNTDIAAWLLEQGLDIEALTSSGRNPVQHAEYYSNEVMASFLRPYAAQAQFRHKQAAQRMIYQGQGGERWEKLDDNRIAQTTTEAAIGYRITAIFNFANSERTRIYRNMETDQESVETTPFDSRHPGPDVQEARTRLIAAGGNVGAAPAGKLISKR